MTGAPLGKGISGAPLGDRDARSPPWGQGCAEPPLGSGMLAAAEAAVTAQMREAAWQKGAGKTKPAPALSACSRAAQKCCGLVLHCSLVPLRSQARGVRGGNEVFTAWGTPPEQLCARGMLQGQEHPNSVTSRAAGHPPRAQGVSQIGAFHLPPLNRGFAATPGRGHWVCPTVLDVNPSAWTPGKHQRGAEKSPPPRVPSQPMPCHRQERQPDPRGRDDSWQGDTPLSGRWRPDAVSLCCLCQAQLSSSGGRVPGGGSGPAHGSQLHQPLVIWGQGEGLQPPRGAPGTLQSGCGAGTGWAGQSLCCCCCRHLVFILPGHLCLAFAPLLLHRQHSCPSRGLDPAQLCWCGLCHTCLSQGLPARSQALFVMLLILPGIIRAEFPEKKT